MTNENIIYNAAINAGLFTPAEAQAIIAAGKRIPLHTYSEWRNLGYQVKTGEHARLSVMLWKPRPGKKDENGEETEDPGQMMRTTAYLFTADQVEKRQPVKAKTAEEIKAYNAMLAAQRKARAVA